MKLKSIHFVCKRCFSLCLPIRSQQPIRKPHVVLGIESSCDDTAVAIISSDRKVLASRIYSDKIVQRRLGGISPLTSATVGRTVIDRLVDECLDESNIRPSDLDAIAVTTRPGLLLSLKVGVDKALSMARRYYLDAIPIHHMRAHAIAPRLLDPTIEYPFLCLLISGGHSIIALVKGPDDFYILGETQKKSPGECLDRIAREMGLPLKTHFAAALEELALKASPEGHLRFHKLPHRTGSDFNFNNIMIHYFNIIHKNNPSRDDLPDLCASAQFTVTAHLCKALALVFEYVEKEKIFLPAKKTLVVSGGVAANKYIRGCITKVSEYYGFNTSFPPPKLCTDNAEMIAWLGLELLETNPQCVIRAKDIPMNASMPPLRIEDRWPIGIDIRNELPQMSEKRLKASSIHGSTPLIFYFKPKEKDVEIESETDEKSASLIDC